MTKTIFILTVVAMLFDFAFPSGAAAVRFSNRISRNGIPLPPSEQAFRQGLRSWLCDGQKYYRQIQMKWQQ
jgi:hypothetical protein